MKINRIFDESVGQYMASLTHLHSANAHQLSVCKTCRGATGEKYSGGRWEQCYVCNQHRNTSGVDSAELADETGFIVYALENRNGSLSQSLSDMYTYKTAPRDQSLNHVITESGQRIRALLYITLRDSLDFFSLNGTEVDVITEVPSSGTRQRREPHTLSGAIDSAISQLPDAPPHLHVLKSMSSGWRNNRELDPDRFTVINPGCIANQHVLLVEDTWVSGVSAQSAAVALHRAGAERVTILCVARLITEGWKDAEYLTSEYDDFPPPSKNISVF